MISSMILPSFTEQTIMSSTTNSAAHTMDPNIPVSEMVELMHDMRNILLDRVSQEELREAKRGVRGAADEQSQHVQCTNPLAANYDYRLNYPENRQYHEHGPEARVWWVYLDEATAFDNDMIGELGDSLDILLVFAGLFSAVVTTFVVQTSQALSVDYATVSASYLGERSLPYFVPMETSLPSRRYLPLIRLPLLPPEISG
ncbi:hypothetical protein F5878DRAFT_721279 [Lentinula raphanica]|uniref:DUF6535 domain-containing protein n=1 Tax=Lentinula raphanica TaxID=153919 RepID=A0AA38UJ60_9AGAR|nr:hypothetical protein F5878DRAFT_721279 [Lentinula raphanica]